ncbi:CBS domain-containing protein [[Eubacterium] cellulosolvens]
MLPRLEEISKRRRVLGLSQKHLAGLAGVSQSLIAKIEAGKTEPSYVKTKAILDTLEKLQREKEPQARHLLQPKVVGVEEEETVSKAAAIMNETGFSQLPVFNGKHIVGSIAEKAIMDRMVAGISLRELSSMPVSKVMTEAFPQIDERTPLSLISALLQYHSAVLVTKRGQVTGIITKADLLKVFSD